MFDPVRFMTYGGGLKKDPTPGTGDRAGVALPEPPRINSPKPIRCQANCKMEWVKGISFRESSWRWRS
jgi:hypothetical protein